MNNKLYAQCREEAIKQIEQKSSPSKAPIVTLLCKDEINQLTAEIYGMKLLDMAGDNNYKKFDCKEWFNVLKHIGTTQDLHDHLVEQFNKEEGK